jgi:hypothetical protein
MPMNPPAATRDEIRFLAQRAGLELQPEYFDELVAAYALVEKMLGNIRRGFGTADEPAHVFVARAFEPEAD